MYILKCIINTTPTFLVMINQVKTFKIFLLAMWTLSTLYVLHVESSLFLALFKLFIS